MSRVHCRTCGSVDRADVNYCGMCRTWTCVECTTDLGYQLVDGAAPRPTWWPPLPQPSSWYGSRPPRTARAAAGLLRKRAPLSSGGGW